MTNDIEARTARTRPLPTGKVTINDLAAHLDLTKGTVSRALNGYSDISADTQERVLRMARKLGYRPSVQARALKTGRTNSVGLVLVIDDDHAHKNFLSDFLDGISRRLGQDDWTLVVATATSHQNSIEVHRRLIAEKKVDGFILPRTKVDDQRVQLLREMGIPFVLYGRTGDPTGCAWFDISGERAMAGAVDRLVMLGHRHIGFIGGAVENNFEGLRLDGFLEGLRRNGLPPDPDLIVDGAMREEQGYERALQLLAMPHPPTALVCALDRAALGVLRAVRELGLRVGEDISVIAYDGIPEGAYSSPPLTTFAVDSRQAGQELAGLLIKCVEGVDPESLRELADAKLIERQSHGRPKRTPEQLAESVAAILDAKPREHA